MKDVIKKMTSDERSGENPLWREKIEDGVGERKGANVFLSYLADGTLADACMGPGREGEGGGRRGQGGGGWRVMDPERV